MRFYGNGVVWDAENDRALCRFSRPEKLHGKGMFDTDDERICAELIRRGYEHEGDAPETEPGEASANMKPEELRAIGKKYGLTFPVGTTKVDMAAAINVKREESK